jgi:uncharacterized metal-binding protein YceD (DUF177 family)
MQEILRHTDAEVRVPGRVEVMLTVFSAASVLVAGRFFAGFEVPCARCLEPAQVTADAELCARFERATPAEVARAAAKNGDDDDDDGISIDPEEIDRFLFSGAQIDLRVMLGEALVMAYPMRALCEHGDACRGLCTNCGANLNGQPEGAGCERCAAGEAVTGSPDGDSGAKTDSASTAEEPQWKAALRKISTDD